MKIDRSLIELGVNVLLDHQVMRAGMSMKPVKIEWRVNLRKTFYCIAKALDSIGIDDINHGHHEVG